MNKLRVGQVGMGWFGNIHLNVWSQLENVELVAVCDKDPISLSQQFENKNQDSFHKDTSQQNNLVTLPKHVQRYKNLDAMLQESDLDVLDVVVTESEHYNVVKKGLESGLDVIVEKPFVLTSQESSHLLSLARKSDSNIYVGQIIRFDPRYVALYENLQTNSKQIYHLSLQRNFQSSAHSVYGNVNPFFGACIHDIDLAIWLIGYPPSRVMATTSSWLEKANPDILIGLLEWEDGPSALIQNVWHIAASCPFGFEFETKVFADERTYILRNEPVLEVWDKTKIHAPEFFFWPQTNGIRHGAIFQELFHFSQCAKEKLPTSRVPVQEIHQGMLVAEALTRSAQTKKWEFIEYKI